MAANASRPLLGGTGAPLRKQLLDEAEAAEIPDPHRIKYIRLNALIKSELLTRDTTKYPHLYPLLQALPYLLGNATRYADSRPATQGGHHAFHGKHLEHLAVLHLSPPLPR